MKALRHWLEKVAGGNTLYYPGCVTQYVLPEVGERYQQLLRQAGVDFIVLMGETLCCGSPVKRAGYSQDFAELRAKNLEIFARFSVRKIITNCPGCYHTLLKDYGIQTLHASQVLAAAGMKAPQGAGAGAAPTITYHDPCHLGRWSGIYDEPRQLLAGAGWAVEELPDNREASLCCGAGGGLKANDPQLADAIARERLAHVRNGRLCTPCPLCYAHFKGNAEGIQVLELSEALQAPEDGRDGR